MFNAFFQLSKIKIEATPNFEHYYKSEYFDKIYSENYQIKHSLPLPDSKNQN